MAKRFSGASLKRLGFTHDEARDFSDDGTRFSVWTSPEGVPVSIANYDGMSYVSVRYDYYQHDVDAQFTFNDFKGTKAYAAHDEFNGVPAERVDAARIAEICKEVAAGVREADEKARAEGFDAGALTERLMEERAEAVRALDFAAEVGVGVGVMSMAPSELRRFLDAVEGLQRDGRRIDSTLEKIESGELPIGLGREYMQRKGYVFVKPGSWDSADGSYWVRCIKEAWLAQQDCGSQERW